MRPLISMLVGGIALVACRRSDAAERWQAVSTYDAGHDSAGCIVTTITTQRFVPVMHGDPRATGFLMLRERTRTRESACAETGESRTAVDAFPGFAHPSAPAVWHLDAEGGDGAIAAESHGFLYRLTVPGCCDTPSVDRYFSLVNGRHLFDTDAPLVEIQMLGKHHTQFLAVEDGDGVRQPEERAHDPMFAAIIAYGDDVNPAERVLVSAPNGMEYHVDSVRMIVDDKVSPYQEILFPQSGRLTVSIVLKQQGDEPQPIHVTIPVTADSLVLARAVSDSGVRVRQVAALAVADTAGP